MIHRVGSYFRTGTFRYPAMAAVAAVFLFSGMLLASSIKLTGYSRAAVAAPLQGSPNSLPSFADLAEALGPAVVNIKVTKVQKTGFADPSQMREGPFGDMFRHFFGDMPRGGGTHKTQGAGSGVIISADGVALTNYHVVEEASEIVVTFSDKREFKARVIGKDPKTDLAVLKLEGKGSFKAAVLGNSEALRVGDWVLAIGNPFGLSNTVTSGIVSAKGRIIGAGPYDDFIQTDAPINPGNSGGPLFNMKGEVVGINTAIIPQGQGIGFAIPVNTAKTLLPQLVSKGQVTRGYLGVSIQNLTENLASSLNMKSVRGVLVSDVVEGSPADKSGIKRGDVIFSYDGKEIKEGHELSSAVAATPVDRVVSLSIFREGKEMALKVKTGKLASAEAETAKEEETTKGAWGLTLQDLSPETARSLGLRVSQGVVVAGVEPGSPADEASVQRGDVIIEVNRKPVKSVTEVKRETQKAGDKGLLLLLVQRGNASLYITMKG